MEPKTLLNRADTLKQLMILQREDAQLTRSIDVFHSSLRAAQAQQHNLRLTIAQLEQELADAPDQTTGT